MKELDFIIVPSRNMHLVHHMVNEYLTDELVTHNGVKLKTYLHKTENKILLEFSEKPDNQIFIFLYQYLTCEPEFFRSDYFGWFGLSDKVHQGSKHTEFGGQLANDHFQRRVMITPEMNEIYVVGFTDSGEKIEFHHSREYKITSESGYRRPQVSYSAYERPIEKVFPPKTKKKVVKKDINHTQWNAKMILARLFLYPFCAFIFWVSIFHMIPDGNYLTPLTAMLLCFVYLSSDLYMIFKGSSEDAT